jgi:ribosomal protein S18 acetylase RimI-like enzyme
MDPAVRLATPDDFDAVLHLMHAYFTYDGITFDAPAVRSGLAELLANPSLGWVFLVTRGADPIGYSVVTTGFDLEFGGKQATVTDLYLHPEHRRVGLGGKLFELIETTAKAAGVRALELQVEHDNPEAHAFYLKHGFVSHSRTPMSKRFSKEPA